MVLACKTVPCKIILDKIKPKPGKKHKRPAHGFKLINKIGTRAKFII